MMNAAKVLEVLRALRDEPVPKGVDVHRSVRDFTWWRLDRWIEAIARGDYEYARSWIVGAHKDAAPGSWERAIYEIAVEASV